MVFLLSQKPLNGIELPMRRRGIIIAVEFSMRR